MSVIPFCLWLCQRICWQLRHTTARSNSLKVTQQCPCYCRLWSPFLGWARRAQAISSDRKLIPKTLRKQQVIRADQLHFPERRTLQPHCCHSKENYLPTVLAAAACSFHADEAFSAPVLSSNPIIGEAGGSTSIGPCGYKNLRRSAASL